MSEESYVSQDDLRMVLRAELAEFKLDILKSLTELATKSEHELLVSRVAILETHGSPQAQEIGKIVAVNTSSIEKLDALKNRFMGALLILTVAFSFAVPVVVQHYF